MIREVRRAQNNAEDCGVHVKGDVKVEFNQIMSRMRRLRAEISPIDGHKCGEEIGVEVFQGFGRFVDSNTVKIDLSYEGKERIMLKFKKLAICTGGRAMIPTDIAGLNDAPYTTNETLFNLTRLTQSYGHFGLWSCGTRNDSSICNVEDLQILKNSTWKLRVWFLT